MDLKPSMIPSDERAPLHAEDASENVPRPDADVDTLLDSLRESVTKGGPAPLNHRLWLNLEEFEGRVDEIVALLPRELRRARRITKEEQRILQDARDDARRVLDEAREEAEQIRSAARDEAERMVEASAIRQRALEQAEDLRQRAETSAREIRDRSYAYAQQVMDNLIQSLRGLTDTVRQDRAQLDNISSDTQP